MLPSDLSPDFVRILASLAKLVVLAMLLERALVIIFDYRWYKKKLDKFGLKVPISLMASWLICHYYKFDVLSALFEPKQTTHMGIFLTAAIVAGGSAGAITLFQGVFKFSKEAQDVMKEAQRAEAETRKMKAAAEIATAEADVAEAHARKAQAEVRMR
ncbi:MAG: hypothetical protein JRD93_15640 [Deltaproteobacteria bacterium]|jgi:predicted RecA/RadA family phage recombinase|nr:hypothetical protein [Deltaproteobacteria bacterium]